MKHYYTSSLAKILQPTAERNLILYGTELLSQIIYENLKAMGKEILYFVDDSCTQSSILGKEVRHPLELLYEDKNDIYVVCFSMKDHGEIYRQLLSYGLEFEKDFAIYGLGGYMQKFNAIDSLLGFSRIYDNGSNFQIYGDPQDKDALSIMVLGGSTSDPTMGNVKTWPQQLYETLRQTYHVTVYSGGMGGYSVHQEFLKFMRDGLAVCPDILITFDGYNDIGYQVSLEEYPYLHRYQKKFYDFVETHTPMAPDTLDMRSVHRITHGIRWENIADYENWFRGISNIHALANANNVRYFSFLQPIQDAGNAILDDSVIKLKNNYFSAYDREASVLKDTMHFVNGCRRYIRENDYMTDLSDIFDNEEDVYYDICHSTEKGHQIIAAHIYEKIKAALEEY